MLDEIMNGDDGFDSEPYMIHHGVSTTNHAVDINLDDPFAVEDLLNDALLDDPDEPTVSIIATFRVIISVQYKYLLNDFFVYTVGFTDRGIARAAEAHER